MIPQNNSPAHQELSNVALAKFVTWWRKFIRNYPSWRPYKSFVWKVFSWGVVCGYDLASESIIDAIKSANNENPSNT